MAEDKMAYTQEEKGLEANVEHPVSRAITYEEEPETGYSMGWHTWAAVVALSLANCCAVFSNTTNTTIKFQVASVGTPSLASWIGNSGFLLTLAFGPIFGTLSDRLGKKWFIVGGCIIGIIGSCISGSATSIYRIIAGNILVGVANAGCITSIAANQEVTINKYRPIAMGINQTFGSSAAILGTFLAAAFVKYDAGGKGGWQWSYYFNAIFYAVTCLSNLVFYNPPPPLLRRKGNLGEIFLRVDWVGIVLLSGSVASLITGLTWGGSTYAWSSGTIIATLVCGCVGLVVLGLWEWLGKKDGIFDHRLFVTANFPILLFVCLVDGMLLLGVNVLYSQEIADMFATDAVKIAAILSPYLITSVLGCFPAGMLMAKTRRYRSLLVGALLWVALFTGLMALVNPHRLAMSCVFSALFGMGTAVTTVIPITALALSVPSFLLGTAGTISISMRALGGIIGITIFTAIFDNKLAVHLPQEVTQAVLGAHYKPSILKEVFQILSVPDSSFLYKSPLPKKLIGIVAGAVAEARQNSWTYVWVAIACIVAANAVASCFLQSVAPRMNQHIESALEQSEVREEQMHGR